VLTPRINPLIGLSKQFPTAQVCHFAIKMSLITFISKSESALPYPRYSAILPLNGTLFGTLG
jgi:hypothetical protein